MTRSASCPPPELVQASRMETLPPDLQARVATHVEACVVCQTLLEAMDDPDIADPTPEERLRIRARVRSGIVDPPLRALRHGLWRWSAAAAAVVVGGVATLLVWQFTNDRSEAPAQTTRLEKPALPARNGRGLVWRGADAGVDQELSRALEPFAANNFPEASRRLSAFVDRHPQNAAAYFYLGVSRMFLGADAEAVARLEQAERLAREDPALAGEIAWYLALAYRRVNQRERAAAMLDALCRGQHARSPHACAALREASGSSASPR